MSYLIRRDAVLLSVTHAVARLIERDTRQRLHQPCRTSSPRQTVLPHSEHGRESSAEEARRISDANESGSRALSGDHEVSVPPRGNTRHSEWSVRSTPIAPGLLKVPQIGWI